MRNVFILVLLSSLFFSCNNSVEKKKNNAEIKEVTTTYYLIRHAEKDRSDPANNNPKLSEVGLERAMKWAQYFENIAIDQIFATDYSRTMQTAAYTASQKNVMIESYDPSDLYNEDFKALTKGHNVLVVGHSNTTPQFVNKIIGEDKYPDIDDNENGMLFMVTVTGDDKNVQIFTVD
ncbi:SixA phosphatase family protein [Ulvibacter litoralis]|uniref:Phosphohistidine phosphatase SixA n=1 Tax=Ulvibacter litoralis TaxID=227084 RepID=A0A1G7I016_9FLAO|nr:phosphoglycerate mutase family protein [Ulvibacter litoralis]GHC62899.1 hypothetical protein GCM10008083_30190 [Ulvibacter litoralis]SDF06137.1 Phosphohistidine phosphatase SixA [Ulvibacter litoralis]